MYSHTYGHMHSLHFQKFSKAANFINFFENFLFTGIANGSVSVDSIFVIAGVMLSYNILRFTSANGNICGSLCKAFALRYFRISAAQLITICIFLLFPLMGSGPLWQAYTDGPLEMCRTKWYLNFLYINNFWRYNEVCLYHTWALSAIMQLTLIGLIIIWILNKSNRYGFLSVIAVIVAGMIGVGIVIALKELPGSLAFFLHSAKTFPIAWRDVYVLPYDHMGPFCIGLLAGYYLVQKKENLKISKLTSSLLWIVCVGCNAAVLFGLFGYRHGEDMEMKLSIFYAITHRNVWAIGISWIIIACATHHGGPLSRVLKSRFFVPMDRLCYMAFLIHMPIQFYHSGVLRERWYMGHLELLYLAIAYVVISFTMSFIIHIIFVSPYLAIENQIASLFRSTTKVVTFDSKTVNGVSNNSIISLEEHTNKEGFINTAYC